MPIRSNILQPQFIQRLKVGIVAFGITTLAGCQFSPDAAQQSGSTAADSKAGVGTASPAENRTLPSMSTYILEQTKGQPAAEPLAEPLSEPGTANAQLAPGQYCFHKKTGGSWLSIRLDLSESQQLSGEGAGTVTHPTEGETLYQQTFTGELLSKQAVVDVTTHIADVTRSRQESWTIEADRLDMGRAIIDQATCTEISADFGSL